MMLKQPKWAFDVTTVKNFNNKIIKVTTQRVARVAGVEDEEFLCIEKGSVNDEKLENNIIRARSKIFEYAICNPWEWFCTFTIDKTKYNRYDLENYHKNLAQFIRDYNKKFGLSIKYLFIPETHKDGAWHEHGFLLGLPVEHLQAFTLEMKLPTYIRDKLKEGQEVFNWCGYSEKFGFCDLEPIRNLEACSNYVRKYISKNLATSVKDVNAHLYYCSKGLNVAETIKKGTLSTGIEEVPTKNNFSNDYVSVRQYTYDEDVLGKILSCIL